MGREDYDGLFWGGVLQYMFLKGSLLVMFGIGLGAEYVALDEYMAGKISATHALAIGVSGGLMAGYMGYMFFFGRFGMGRRDS